MRDLDDPDNPYRGHYEEWDSWTYNQVRATTNETLRDWYQGNAPADYCLLTIRVDKAGNVVPLRMSTADDLAMRNDPNYTPETDCRFSLRGGGIADPEIMRDLSEMLVSLRLPYAPDIPQWLAAMPPRKAIFMPGGEIVTSGEPDPSRQADYRPQNLATADLSESITRRYDLHGNLVAETDPGAPWFSVYFTGFAEILAEMESRNCTYWEYGGYIVFNEVDSRNIVAIYDYDGSEIPINSQINWYENRFETIPGTDLPVLFRLQNNAG